MTVETGKNGSRISRRQMKALMFVSLLSPVIRLFPTSSVSMGGKGAWLSPLLAVPAVLLLYAMINRFMKNAGPDEGLGDMIIRAAGKNTGKLTLAVIGLWLVFYTGFIVKSSAERLLSSVYPNGQPALFAVTLLLVAVWIASGKIRSLGRTSEIFASLIGVILLIILVASVFKVKIENLLPVTVRDIDNIAVGAIPVVNVLGIGVYLMFLGGSFEKSEKKNFRAVLLLTVVVAAITTVTLGVLGKELINSLQHSFFVMIRDIDIIGVIERIEAVVIISWVMTDLIYAAVLLKVCSEVAGTVFKKENKRKYIFISAFFSLIVAVFVIENAFSMHFLSGIVIPIINILVVFIILPLLFVVGTFRQKI